jgi:hypothetical protein
MLDKATLTMMMSPILIITAICAPLVSIFYKPLNLENHMFICHTVQNVHRTHSELHVLTCFFDENPIPTLLDFFECLTSLETQTYTYIYPLHLVDLNASIASSLISHRSKSGQINIKQMEPIHKHLISFGQVSTYITYLDVSPALLFTQDLILSFLI